MADSSRVRLVELHGSLLRHDRVALEQPIAELHLVLCRKLRRSFRRVDPDDLADAATDAILLYVAQPHRFDDTRGVPLPSFVCGIAARILRNRIRSRLRRSAREDRYAAHSMDIHQSLAINNGAHAVLVQQVQCALELVCSARELAAVMAWLGGQNSAVVAKHLGVDGLQPTYQRREVELLTRRITKRLQRHFRAKRIPLKDKNIYNGRGSVLPSGG